MTSRLASLAQVIYQRNAIRSGGCRNLLSGVANRGLQDVYFLYEEGMSEIDVRFFQDLASGSDVAPGP